jgi:AraC-like DNA-binding protein
MRMETVVRTDDLPAAERFPFWLEAIRHAVAPYEIRSDHATGFRASLRTMQLGAVQLTVMSQQALEARRTRKLIRQSDPEHYHVGINIRGRVMMSQGGRTTEFMPGDLMVCDTSRPFHTITDPGDTLGTGLNLAFPRALLPLPESKVADLIVRRLPGRNGIGGLLSRYLLQLAKDPGQYGPSDTARLSAITLDLLAATFAQALDADNALPAEAHQRALLTRIHAFIDQHLTDPALTPETIAAAHHLSTRTLQRLFHAQDTTVAAWIRTRRLDRCRHDLAEPLLRIHSIQTIATRWGFTNPAHFSRTFKNAHGVSPRAYRQQAQNSAT